MARVRPWQAPADRAPTLRPTFAAVPAAPAPPCRASLSPASPSGGAVGRLADLAQLHVGGARDARPAQQQPCIVLERRVAAHGNRLRVLALTVRRSERQIGQPRIIEIPLAAGRVEAEDRA